LVIILVFLVMIFLLPLAFFIQSGMQRQVANTSTIIGIENILAEGAIEQIMSDLEQEIAAGSTPVAVSVTNVAAGTVSTNLVYYPTASVNMAPALAGSSGTSGLENLVKRSAFGIASYPGGPSCAIPSSSTYPSLNGFYVTMAKWNQHLLLARANPNSGSDTTPTNSFTPPDWIVVARDGTIPTNWSQSLCWSSTNTTTAVGRYAYAVYDEGGILDANVAGYPAALTNQSALPVCGKGGEFFADLTQVGLDANQISALIAWRNYASASATGTFPGYTIPDNGLSYSLATLGNNSGFMETCNTSTVPCSNSSGVGTDHQFTSRQELISFLESCEPGNAAAAMNALRYLGTFTRCFNQPSFKASSTSPTVLPLANGGNNASAYGNDRAINPSFLEIEVNSNSFVRNNGSIANVGDPLVKKRFPLSLLSWITYVGPSANNGIAWAPYISAGIPQPLLMMGSANNIQGYFGLTWNSNAASSSYGSWTYRAGSNQPIMTLSQVAAVGRDPDFFELLKAAITVGSLGKAYTYSGAATNTNAWSTPLGYNEVYDNWTDAQIIQIGANIIGQSRPDSYPTRIQFSDGTTFGGATVEIRSVQDLPYIYRIREGKIMIRDSSPSVSVLPMLTNGWSATNGGSGIVLQEPEIWNPHAMRTNVTTNPVPTNFRLLAISTDPITASQNSNVPTVNFTLSESWIPYSGTVLSWQSSTPTNLNSSNATLSFTIPSNRQDLFREPTLLIKPGVPSGSSLSGSTSYSMATNMSAYQYGAIGVADNGQYIGIPMGTVPMAFSATFGHNGIASGAPSSGSGAAGIAPTGYVTYLTNGNAGLPSVTYLLQCQDYFGNWITYDEKYTSVASSTNAYPPSNTGTNTNSSTFRYNQNKTFYTDSTHTNWSKNAIGSEWSVIAFDPRTTRFGMIFSGCGGDTNTNTPIYSIVLGSAIASYSNAPLYTAGWAAPIGTSTNATAMQYAAQQNAALTIRPDEYSGMLLSSNSIPTAAGWYPAASVMRPGMLVQNNPNISESSTQRFSTDPQSAAFNNQFFADPDGVVRRGIGGFVPFGNFLPATVPNSGLDNPSGIPLLPAYSFSATGIATAIQGNTNANEYLSRPVMLNRPFRTVAELGYVFSGTPWRNLSCSAPESGAAALLDVFCINDTTDSLGLVAGRVNLNTRQLPVLQAILTGAYKEEFNPNCGVVDSLMSTNLANAVAQALITRTKETNAPAGPLVNISDLVGKWFSNTTIQGTSSVNGSSSYAGFSDDNSGANGSASNDLTSILSNPSLATDPEQRIERFRDTSIRALSSAGQTRVWNLMIDLVVETGRYPSTASNFNSFIVDGQVHYWFHLAIDRLTGELLDRRVETVKE